MNLRKPTAAMGALVLLIAGAWFGWQLMSKPVLPQGILEAHGRIEATEVTVSSRVPGRIVEFAVKEGDQVQRGNLIAVLSAEEVGQRLTLAEARVGAAEAQLQQREQETRARLAEANAKLTAAQERLLQIGERVDVLQHHLKKARADNQRDRELLAKNFISERQMSNSDNLLRQTEGEVTEGIKMFAAASAEVDAARAARDGIAKQSPALLRSLEKEAAGARALREEASAIVSELRVLAPQDGVVITKAAQAGELAFPGQALVVLADLERPYLRVYLAEIDVGKVKLGDAARVYVDSFPDRPFDATVTEIANKAEFTPKDVHMPDERTMLVYGVKLEIRNSDGFAKPGMPASARIRWKPDAPWSR